MKVLGLDAAGAGCSAALWVDGSVIARRHRLLERGHAEALMPMVAAVLEEAGLAADAIDRWAVTVGPGAFTGLRIGLAAARGLGLATGRPVLGFTSFEAVVWGLGDRALAGREVLVAIESRRNELFLQHFDPARRPLGAPLMLAPEAVAVGLSGRPLLLAGDGAERLVPLLSGHPALVWDRQAAVIDAAVVARLGAERPPEAALPPRPLYLRAPDVTLPPGRRA